MWGRPTIEAKNDDDQSINEGKNINYKTECPIYDPSNILSQTAEIEIENNNLNTNNIQSQVKSYYPLNLNTYNDSNKKVKGFHPYYPSMNKSSMVSFTTSFCFNRL